MYLNESLKNNLERCCQQIEKIEQKISLLPAGRFHITANGSYYTWRVTNENGKRIYLPKSEEETARKYVLKEYYLAQLHDLKTEAEAYRRCVRYQEHSVSRTEDLISGASPEFRRLLGETFRTRDERAAAWENQAYHKSGEFPEQLIHATLKPDEYVRSKLEATAAVNLKELSIPYLYEKISRIGSADIATDFWTLDTRTFQEVPIEIFGMMDKPDYQKIFKLKMKTYIDAGYIPGVNFLTFYETGRAPLNPRIMREELEYFFFVKPPVQFRIPGRVE